MQIDLLQSEVQRLAHWLPRWRLKETMIHAQNFSIEFDRCHKVGHLQNNIVNRLNFRLLHFMVL